MSLFAAFQKKHSCSEICKCPLLKELAIAKFSFHDLNREVSGLGYSDIANYPRLYTVHFAL